MKKNVKNLLFVLLASCLALSNILVPASVNVSAETQYVSLKNDLTPLYTADWTGNGQTGGVVKEGYGGSYAYKIGGNNLAFNSKIDFLLSGLKTLTNYTVEFVYKSKGVDSALRAVAQLDNYTMVGDGAYWLWGENSAQWGNASFNFTTLSTVAGTYLTLIAQTTLTDNYAMFDNFVIYETADQSKTNIFPKGGFDVTFEKVGEIGDKWTRYGTETAGLALVKDNSGDIAYLGFNDSSGKINLNALIYSFAVAVPGHSYKVSFDWCAQIENQWQTALNFNIRDYDYTYNLTTYFTPTNGSYNNYTSSEILASNVDGNEYLYSSFDFGAYGGYGLKSGEYFLVKNFKVFDVANPSANLYNTSVSFDVGNVGAYPVASQLKVLNSTYGTNNAGAAQTLPVISNIGYVFEGWYKEASFINKVTNTTKVTTENDHSLFASWTKVGDSNKDGSVDITDMAVAKQHIIKISQITSENIKYLDFTLDGKVTISDLLILKKEILNIQYEWPYTISATYNTDYANGGPTAQIRKGIAYSGSYACALGFSLTNATSNKVDWKIYGARAGVTYVFKYAIKAVGSITSGQVGFQGANYTFVPFAYYDSSNTEWLYSTYEYTPSASDISTGFYFSASLTASANGSGFIIDSVSIKEKNLTDVPNLFSDGSFETYTQPISIPRVAPGTEPAGMGGFHVSYDYDPAVFSTLLSSNYMDTFIFSSENRNILEYNIKKVAAVGKKSYVMLQDSIKTVSTPLHTLIPNWQAKIDEIYQTCVAAGGSSFQGVYFDEPFLYFSSDDFTSVTQYINQTYGRRIFTVYQGSDLDPINSIDSQYVTDVGYTNYNLWGTAQTTNFNNFKTALLSMPSTVRVWFVPVIGKPTPDFTDANGQAECTKILMGYYQFARQCTNFGGFMFYSYEFTPNGKAYVLPDGVNPPLWNNLYNDITKIGVDILTAQPLRSAIFDDAGYYKATNSNSFRVMDVTGSSTSAGTILIQKTSSGISSQQWNFIDLGNGYFKIINKNSGLAADVTGGSVSSDARIIQSIYTGENRMQWQIIDIGNALYKIVNRNSGMCIQALSGSTSDSVQLVQNTYSGTATQKWKLEFANY